MCALRVTFSVTITSWYMLPVCLVEQRSHSWEDVFAFSSEDTWTNGAGDSSLQQKMLFWSNALFIISFPVNVFKQIDL